eukprot:TRINITY_DN8279_c0_g1_i1.p1 TRINITY_DN8279_c0_g1~~TRINITY_DN8279_c0_g1_i1.p1  ORF type:complete len:451 (-),score=81.17 TRINITY_DN8279_c0_g1_i1:79-1431(-)
MSPDNRFKWAAVLVTAALMAAQLFIGARASKRTVFPGTASIARSLEETLDFRAGSWQEWAVAWGVFFVLNTLLDCLGLKKAIQGITMDVIEHVEDIGTIKDTVRNIWTHFALIDALFVTITIPMALSTDIGELQARASDKLAPFFTAYFVLTGTASLFLLMCICECVLHLIYTEALTPPGVMRYIISNPGCIGGMAAMTMKGIMWGCTGMIMGIGFIAGPPAVAVCSFLALLLAGIFLGMELPTASAFSPHRTDPGSKTWLWAEDPQNEDWKKLPMAKELGTKPKVLEMIRMRARQAREYEEASAAARLAWLGGEAKGAAQDVAEVSQDLVSNIFAAAQAEVVPKNPVKEIPQDAVTEQKAEEEKPVRLVEQKEEKSTKEKPVPQGKPEEQKEKKPTKEQEQGGSASSTEAYTLDNFEKGDSKIVILNTEALEVEAGHNRAACSCAMWEA